jgi:hypothetical protein
MAHANLTLRHLPRATVYHAPATGRNRGLGRFDINWYCWLRSTLYFALQNGRRDVGVGRACRRAVAHASWFWELLGTVVRNGELDAAGAASARRQLRRAMVEGLATGLVGPRQIPRELSVEARSLQAFLPAVRAGAGPIPAPAREIPA